MSEDIKKILNSYDPLTREEEATLLIYFFDGTEIDVINRMLYANIVQKQQILQIKNEYQLQALVMRIISLMLKKEIINIEHILRFDDPSQVEALKIPFIQKMLEDKNPVINIEHILSVYNEFQVKALKIPFIQKMLESKNLTIQQILQINSSKKETVINNKSIQKFIENQTIIFNDALTFTPEMLEVLNKSLTTEKLSIIVNKIALEYLELLKNDVDDNKFQNLIKSIEENGIQTILKDIKPEISAKIFADFNRIFGRAGTDNPFFIDYMDKIIDVDLSETINNLKSKISNDNQSNNKIEEISEKFIGIQNNIQIKKPRNYMRHTFSSEQKISTAITSDKPSPKPISQKKRNRNI